MKTTIAVVSGAIGIVLFAGAVRELKATTTQTILPPNDVLCYHNLWTCSYEEGTGYWTGCDPNQGPGEISTPTAAQICTTYHDS